ncbi:hypothetical protein PC129_g1613 [Phytophthora cactorum]|uniref:Concanavalin A-like lectin/glucanase domain n=1 Tax=Phytophthora cactorum TaxID=29920 RepID=A0A8T1LCH7_9STRA|nr:hypothetical protein PC112_g2810 [Phytophthora cactorum]KAG2928430.1 hypothetical protein PC114_g3127 [Phytophthora cactorum]KAG2952333.1 hypothetical protein PC117_g2899 [Phytophthora cactorum]KAG3030856.1 hypothetical protein PC120_g3468 [Phytophthora cactorum]KAG3101667.1 hypothetical protein PC122_g2571 [Phytophthora cactorum]
MAALSWRSLPDEVLVAIRKLYIPRLSHVRYERGSTCVRESDLELIHRSADSKRQYALESSLRFGGQPVGLQAKRLPQSYAPVFRSTDTLFGLYAREAAPSFTLDAWFSLSPVEQGVRHGGVLLGLQSEKCREEGELEFGRWYHVALVFEQRFQKVYLDGALVDSQHDQEQQLESFLYYYAQVGTGFVSDDAYNGWYMYGFYGVVDDLRVWHEAMSSEQIAALSRDGAAVLVRPTFSLKRDVPAWMAYGVEKVRCSRPRERWCEVVAACSRTEDRESWI